MEKIIIMFSELELLLIVLFNKFYNVWPLEVFSYSNYGEGFLQIIKF